MLASSSVVGAFSSSGFFPLPSGPKPDCIARIEEIIKRTRLDIAPDLDSLCPITKEVFKDPVRPDQCTHVFERAGIQQWIDCSQNNTCPLCMSPISTLKPSFGTTESIMKAQLSKEFVLTASDCESENQELATQYMEKARSCTDRKDYKGAIDALTLALKYTHSSDDYAFVPIFYDQSGDSERALLSRLYLSLYQLQEGKVPQAIETLKNCKSSSLIVEIVLQLWQSPESFEWAKKCALNQQELDEKVSIYKQIILHDPYQFDVHKELIALTNDLKEKRELLLKAADLACFANKSNLQSAFRKEAEFVEAMVITKKGWEDPQTIHLPPYPQALRKFLEGDCIIFPGKKRSETHIVVPLFPYVILNNDMPRVPLTLETLNELDKSSKGTGYSCEDDGIFNDIPDEKGFRYAVMTRDIMPGSRKKTFDEQLGMLPAGYKMPSAFDAVRAFLWEYRSTGNRCFPDSPWIYTHCCDDEIQDCRVVVGGFTSEGPTISLDSGGSYIYEGVGFALWQEFCYPEPIFF